MYAKIFTQIFDSSIAENWQTRLVFEDLLKLADINGVVDKTPESIARRTNVPLEIVKRGIAELEMPDARSRNSDHDGARIIRLDDHRDWGWMIVNYAHYRGIASEEQRREKTALRVKRHRDKLKCTVTRGNAGNAKQRQTETEKKIEKVNLIKAPLNKLTASAAAMKRIASEIVSNKHDWFWDNCKVKPGDFVPASLETVLLPYADTLAEKSIHAAWHEAVKRTHDATVDTLANDPVRYCVGCFKTELESAVKRAKKIKESL
ncbi:MAG: hypothetical protein ACREFE_01785 [Limisphaerales bacterium]